MEWDKYTQRNSLTHVSAIGIDNGVGVGWLWISAGGRVKTRMTEGCKIENYCDEYSIQYGFLLARKLAPPHNLQINIVRLFPTSNTNMRASLRRLTFGWQASLRSSPPHTPPVMFSVVA